MPKIGKKWMAVTACLGVFALPMRGCSGPWNNSPPPPQHHALVTKIDERMARAISDRSVPGGSVAVASEGTEVYAHGYGYANVEDAVPAMPSTVYRIGSITKTFTAAAIMDLVEHGRLSIDDEVTKFIPAYPTNGYRLTVRNLLNQTSGIPDYYLDPPGSPGYEALSHQKVSKAEILSLFAGKLNFPTGQQYEYSNSNYFLLGLIIEQVSRQSYASYLSEHIFAPLHMRDTFYCPDSPTGPSQARGYTRGPDGSRTPVPTSFNIDTAFGAGGLCSTVQDLVRWNNAFHGHRILAASYDQMISPGGDPEGSTAPYGFGFMLDDYFHTISHGGGIEGFTGWLWYLPDYKVTVVVLVNNDYNFAMPFIRGFESLFTPPILGAP